MVRLKADPDLFMRTIGDYIDGMRHALGKTPASGHDLYHSLNDAGRQLFAHAAGEWRNVGPVSCPAVADQPYLDLPGDFGTHEQAWVPNTGSYTGLAVVSRAAMAAMMAVSNVQVSSGVLSVCFEGATNTPGSETKPKALLYPTPSANGSPVVRMFYRRRWVTVTSGDDAKSAPIPEDLEHALQLGANLVAWNRENPTNKLDPGEYVAAVELFKREDSRRQVVQGQMPGGVPVGYTGGEDWGRENVLLSL